MVNQKVKNVIRKAKYQFPVMGFYLPALTVPPFKNTDIKFSNKHHFSEFYQNF